MKLKIHYVLLLVFFFTILTLFPSISGGTEENVDVLVEKHVLLPGAHLVEILRKTYQILDHHIFNEYLNFIKGLNPEIKDLNNMRAYQIILIPLSLPPENKKYKITILQPERITRDSTTIPPQDTTALHTPKPLPKGPLAKVNIKKLLQEDLSTLLAESDISLLQEGIYEFQDYDGSQLFLDTAYYPLLQLKNSTTIIIDTDDRLSTGIREAVKSNWNNCKIIPSGKDQDLQSMLDQLIEEIDFFKVIKHGDPLVRGQDVICKIVGDWIIFPDSALQRVFVINLIHTSDHKVPTSIRSFLESMAIELIDIELFEQAESKDSFISKGEGNGTETAEIVRIDFAEKLAFIDTLLTLAGQEYAKNVPISVYSRDNTSLALKVTIDRTFLRNGKKHLIYLQNKPPKLLNLLIRQGFPLLRLTHKEDAVTTIKKVLDFLEVRYQSPIITFAACVATRNNKVWINIPGIFFNSESKKVFLTHLELHPALNSFLREKNITTAIYQ